MMSWMGFSESGSRNCSRKRLAFVGFKEELGEGEVGSLINDWAFCRRFERVNIVGEGK